MTPESVMTMGQKAMEITLTVSAPLLLVALAMGLLISIFQAATQINESTLTFVPKVLVVAAILTVFGPGMLGSLVDFTRSIFLTAGQVAR